MGERSYSLYLLHFVVVTLVATHDQLWVRVGGPVTTAAATGLLVVLPATLALSWLTFASVEQPFLRMRGTYVRPVAGSGAGTAGAAPADDRSGAEPVAAADRT